MTPQGKQRIMSDLTIPPKPEEPSPHECCGSGCVPCIFDYYYEQLDKWNEKYGEESKRGQKPEAQELNKEVNNV